MDGMRWQPLLVLVLGFSLMGCDLSELVEDEEEGAAPVAGQTAPAGDPNAVLTVNEFERIEDPVEQCFTVEVPKGWHNRAYVARAFDVHREVITCVSPNSETVLFVGDPNIPQYWNPDSAHEIIQEIARVNPMVDIAAPETAQDYMPTYVQDKFGKLDDFKMGSVTDNPELVASFQKLAAEHGMQAQASAVTVRFNYTDKGKPMSALVIGTAAWFDGFWMVSTSGISTTGNADDYLPLLMKIGLSKKTNPEWTAKQNALHEQRMAEIRAFGERMTAQHHQNMSAIQASAQRHQQRMQAIWAAGDASTRAYYERSAASDAQHQGFLNYINEENTVSAGGQTFQVDNSYQRYWVNPSTGQYLGGDINFDDRSIRAMGLNPDDYQEAQIRR
jgi:hypothetical protein